jgi:hypothetical protein
MRTQMKAFAGCLCEDLLSLRSNLQAGKGDQEGFSFGFFALINKKATIPNNASPETM